MMRLPDLARAVLGWPPDLARFEAMLMAADECLPGGRDCTYELDSGQVIYLVDHWEAIRQRQALADRSHLCGGC